MNSADFVPYLRFMVCSDVHYRDEGGPEPERLAKAIRASYRIAEADPDMKTLDAVYVVGDFADSGSEKQMRRFQATLNAEIRPETRVVLSVASHETGFNRENPRIAWDRFRAVFGQEPDSHHIIKGFHFIMVSPSIGCAFHKEKIDYAASALARAAAEDPQKPIFFFQHPHITDTVYGSINWGEKQLYPTLCNYPQIIDFSGHSHAPVNDPRSIHQEHFTCLGTGSLSYFELDEFDKYTDTCPPGVNCCAQMLIVEASREGAVRIRPYDVITESFFPVTHFIPTPWLPESFTYTREAYPSFLRPWFLTDKMDITVLRPDGFTVTFDQATSDYGFCDDYRVTVYDGATGLVAAKKLCFSEYYLKALPPRESVSFDGLKPGRTYRVEVAPGNFRRMYGKPLTALVTL